MSVLQEILTWSQKLPDWQSDAIARLFKKHVLEAEDIDDLYALLKADNGISDPQGRIAKRLSEDQISVPAHSGARVELLCIKNLTRVNAIANNQTLSFGANGLTVIYGDNGSGKSGYSRVLKQACRARDQQEPILPNANFPPEKGKAEASFEIKVDGTVREEKWVDGTSTNAILSSIAIFDHRCARAYVDDEDDYSYVPYGLDIFEELAKVCNQLKEKIDVDLLQCEVNTSEFDEFRGSTSVGHLIENLSSGTKIDDVEIIAKIEPNDRILRDTLNKSLHNDNPLENAERLRRISQRIIRILKVFHERDAVIRNSEILRFSDLDKKLHIAREASELAKKTFNESGNFLPGTCGDAWRELYEAARKYSEYAYPGKPFPYVKNGSKCLLCQQPLQEGSSRLLQFEEFVQQDTEQTVQIRQKEFDDAKDIFFNQDFVSVVDEQTIAEIASYDKNLSEECITFEKIQVDRYRQISDCFTTHAWSEINEVSENPSIKLESLVLKINDEANIFEEADKAESRKKILKNSMN